MDDFVRFLEVKTGGYNCPACGNSQWTVLGKAGHPEAYRVVSALRDGQAPNSMSSFALFCNDCGFVRQHMARVVRKWVTENPEPQQDLPFEDFEDPDLV